ncbi:sensor histidine kinase [Actinosynnema sp.]|uniref:sensor histidine kinase n=1 Tax=Actinosynnema sp. TaxID=1872144 RepID=UPI003F85B758
MARNSWLIALVCVIGDVSALLVFDELAARSPGALPTSFWAALVVVALADLALALPARFTGAVTLAQAAARIGTAVLLGGPDVGVDGRVGNATGLVAAGYLAGAWLRGRWAWVALGALVLGVLGARWTAVPPQPDAVAVLAVEALTNALLPWLAGRYTSSRIAFLEEVKRKRRDAEEQVARALAEERGALARDLHDTISHHVSAIGVHAGAARLRLAGLRPAGLRSTGQGGDPKLDAALGQVERSGHAALADLRRMLDVLHGATRDSTRQPGLSGLDDLVDGVRATGVPVEVSTEALRPDRLPGSLDVAAYRAAQELLTNALRHGDGERVELRITQSAAELVVSVANGVRPGPPAHGSRRGLDGVRHRAALFGGGVVCGPDGGSWRATATFPLEATP